MDVSYNNLGGPLPDFSKADPYLLSSLVLSHNQFRGPLPNLSKLRTDWEIELDNNDFEGDVATAFGSINPPINCKVANNSQILCPITYTSCCYTPPSCDDHQCVCSSNLTTIAASAYVGSCNQGTWAINGQAVNNQTLVVGAGDIIVINGSLIQTDQATLVIYTNGSTAQGVIQVSDSAQLAGSLVIVIPTTAGSVNIQILNGTNITGNFTNIYLQQQQNATKCKGRKITPSYTSTSVSVLISEIQNTCGNSDNMKIIGIAVGSSVGGLFIIVIVIIIIFVIVKQAGICGGREGKEYNYHAASSTTL